MLKCWEFYRCEAEDCPAYGDINKKCWLIEDTKLCSPLHDNVFIDKIEICVGCKVFQINLEFDEVGKAEIIDYMSSKFRKYHELIKAYSKVGQEFELALFDISQDTLFLPLLTDLNKTKVERIKDAINTKIAKKNHTKLIIDVGNVLIVNEDFIKNLISLKRHIKFLGMEVIIAGVNTQINEFLVKYSHEFIKDKTCNSLPEAIISIFS